MSNIIYKIPQRSYLSIMSKDKTLLKFFNKHPLITGILGSLLASGITSVVTIYFSIPKAISTMELKINALTESQSNLESNMSDLHIDATVASLQTNIENINTQIKRLDDSLANLNSAMYSIVNSINERVDNLLSVQKIKPLDEVASIFTTSYIASSDMHLLNTPVWNSSDDIAINVETQEKFSAEELANHKLLFRYTDGNEESFFYGQFNENNQWDGNCIINTYSNNNLTMIMDAVYDNGRLYSYKQVIPSTKNDVWYVSKRKNEGAWNSGETWTYFKKEDVNKSFTNSSISAENILDLESFISLVKINGLEGYYCGNTSNGFFNDDTGNAFLIKYNTDGLVRYFYHGKILNGQAHDMTEGANSWEIAWGYDNDGYYFYQGRFDSTKDKNKIDLGDKDPNKISLEEIHNIINEMHINYNLYWIGDEIAM